MNPYDNVDQANKPTKKMIVPKHKTTERYIGRYKVLDTIGKGGMGTVYKAQHVHSQTIIAIKVFVYGNNTSIQDVQRFLEEARTTAKLNHPNIIKIYDVKQLENYSYIVMEFIDGLPLNKAIKAYGISFRKSIEIIKQVASLLEYTHKNNIIHRDIKPENILIRRNLKPLLMDFGIAKNLNKVTQLTLEGELLGTPHYIAPEQAGLGDKNSPATDIYSLGAVLYEVICGSPPFTGETDFEVLYNVANQKVMPPSTKNPNVPKELDYICLKALKREPKNRHSSAREFGRELGQFLKDGTVPTNGKTSKRRENSQPENLKTYVFTAIAGMLISTTILISYNLLKISDSKPVIDKPIVNENKETKTVEQPPEDFDISKQNTNFSNQSSQQKIQKLKNTLQAKMQIQDIVGAIGIAKNIEILNGNDLQNLLVLASLHQGKKDFIAGIEYCDKVLSKDKKNAAAYQQRGYIYFSMKEFDLCLEDLKVCLNYTNNKASIYHYMAQCYIEKKDFPQAIKCCNAALQTNPNLANIYYTRAKVYLASRQYPQAINDFNILVRSNPNHAQTLQERGVAFMQAQQYKQAIADFVKVLQLSPGNVPGLVNMGRSLMFLQEHKRAIDCVHEAIKISPTALNHFYASQILYTKKPLLTADFQHILKHLNHAIQLNPQFVAAYFMRGNTYANIKNNRAASNDLNYVIKLMPNSDMAIKARQRIQQFK
ncbi:protein kinase [Candidatus Uabimicrobium sp. HlEnr_7]|uniref:protein kinase domain-containing protein n=1 Tax=Candidatus Uabimicrobium helgolandensis TaxID=3095367 RepID=UPI00355907AE